MCSFTAVYTQFALAVLIKHSLHCFYALSPIFLYTLNFSPVLTLHPLSSTFSSFTSLHETFSSPAVPVLPGVGAGRLGALRLALSVGDGGGHGRGVHAGGNHPPAGLQVHHHDVPAYLQRHQPSLPRCLLLHPGHERHGGDGQGRLKGLGEGVGCRGGVRGM